MLRLLGTLWNDERGAVVTAEVALLATMGAAAATVGVHSLANSVDGEFRETAGAFRRLDQSYVHYGFCKPGAATAGSAYQQPPVQKSLQELRRYEERLERELQGAKRERQQRTRKP